ncbi:MAG: glycosyltransferase involved in cell wall biosynthesis [Zhongshania aliphaticivorans]
MSKIIFVTYGDYRNVVGGGGVYTSQIVSSLKVLGFNVVALNAYDYIDMNRKWLRKLAAFLRSFFSSYPLPVLYFYNKSLLKAFERELKMAGADGGEVVVAIDHIELAYLLNSKYVCKVPNFKFVHFSHNFESDVFSQRLTGVKGILKKIRFVSKYIDFERKTLPKFDICFSISSDDIEKYRSVYNLNVIHLPLAFERKLYNDYTSSKSAIKLVFLANMDWWPNREALTWIIDVLAPKLPAAYTVEVYGKGTEKYQLSSSQASIKFNGFVNDVSEIWTDAFFSLAPISSGSGVNVKVVESLASEVPVLTTMVGAKGIMKNEAIFTLALNDPMAWVSVLERYRGSLDDYLSLRREIIMPTNQQMEGTLRRLLWETK